MLQSLYSWGGQRDHNGEEKNLCSWWKSKSQPSGPLNLLKSQSTLSSGTNLNCLLSPFMLIHRQFLYTHYETYLRYQQSCTNHLILYVLTKHSSQNKVLAAYPNSTPNWSLLAQYGTSQPNIRVM